jgi:hypothetical protein
VTEPQPPAAPPSPWNPAPARARSGPGCSKPLLLGCGVLIVLLGIGAVIFLVKMPSIVQWWFQKLESTLEQRLPADATPAEKTHFHAAFESARHALASGTVDASRMQPFQSRLLAVGSSEQRMTHAQLHDLTVALEGLAGKPAEAPPGPARGSGPSGATGTSPPR